jgi:hypothetical protein
MKLFNPFKKRQPNTALHPDIKRLISKVKTVKDKDGAKIDLYMFNTPFDMPAGRYSALNEFIEDYRRGLDRDELKVYINELIKNLDNDTISVKQLSDTLIVLKWMAQRLAIAVDVDLVLRIISASLFTVDEDLTEYDYDYGSYKIELIEKNGLSAFFLHEPLRRYWTQTDISKDDLEILMEQRKIKRQVLKELTEMGMLRGGITTGQ